MTEAEFEAALAGGDDVAFDAAGAAAARTLAAEWVSRALVSGAAVRIENALIAGVVLFENVTLAGPLTLVNCRIERLSARSCTFAAPVRIVRSQAGSIDVAGSRFERAFSLQLVECDLLDISGTSFAEGFAFRRSTIARLSNVSEGRPRMRTFAFDLSAKRFARAIRRRPARAALVASLVLHFFAMLFVWQRHVEPAAESVASVQRLVFERKPRPSPRPIRRIPVTPHHVAIVRAAPVVRAHVMTRPPTVAPHVVPKPLRAPPAHAQPKELAKAVPRPAVSQRHVLSDSRIAQIDNDLRSAIASDRGRLDPLARTTSPLAAPKHYAIDAASFSEGDRRHRGLCDPIKDWHEGDYDYYYVICNVRFSDGTFQRQGVPWPVRFPKTDDPFNGSAAGEKPLAMPLPGWHLGPGDTVTPELREYARANGVDLDAAQ